MAKVPTVRVRHPESPDDYMVINKADYDEEVHELFDDEASSASDGDGDGGSQELPDGYRTERAGGSYFHLFGPDDEPIEGPSNGKWQGKDAAIEAAQAHAAEGAEE